VVLVHCESLYESLYDLLNQHYTEYGGQLYVRLAFGTHRYRQFALYELTNHHYLRSRLCPIHRNFRIVVVVEKIEAYTRLAPPLLNRFEKQGLLPYFSCHFSKSFSVMERQHLLTEEQHQLVQRLKQVHFLLLYCVLTLCFCCNVDSLLTFSWTSPLLSNQRRSKRPRLVSWGKNDLCDVFSRPKHQRRPQRHRPRQPAKTRRRKKLRLRRKQRPRRRKRLHSKTPCEPISRVRCFRFACLVNDSFV